jgi:hypothetical protein
MALPSAALRALTLDFLVAFFDKWLNKKEQPDSVANSVAKLIRRYI